ncbi:undecaprenyl-diphosphate phosphatase [Sphingomonas oligoaromativorans]|jgi:undecaprenyl-diphosphatase|uniref:undecaprenyl-diphosphate phosphatase n=1 Tax=Sphingomonas oligoaromativorans TaxID=575322 RepID=UPI0014206110|nr:undecaprenyl-diphosphate phosphatase [Sphingomonas oligoaromativorans]NIJ34904.1 undecaprenyl-diphosphatase [Sphingomonas oligoaromativorans]
MMILQPILLGIVEGLTEFLPVSSTGHLILAGALLGYDDAQWQVFNIVIQLGAILAIVVLYWRTFMAVLHGLMRGRAESWRFLRNILIAFLPAAVIGLAFHKRIEALLTRPDIVCYALIAGGVAILLIERLVKRHRLVGVSALPVPTTLGIGFIQCLAMIPGVSRSGATILGALSLGVERRTAAEFSFFLAIPTMLGATVLELAKNRAALAAPGAVGWPEIAIGFVTAFLVALVVVKAFVSVVSRHGFAPFAWYRIVAGAAALFWLMH